MIWHPTVNIQISISELNRHSIFNLAKSNFRPDLAGCCYSRNSIVLITKKMAAAAKLPGLVSSAIAQARPKFNIFMKYARVELAPPKMSEIPQIKSGLAKLVNSAKTGAWKDQTMKQATVNTLIGAEVLFWFYIGECIGKRHLVGYDV